jgi:hypothetical protein
MSSSLTRNPNLDLTSSAVHNHSEEARQRNLGRCALSIPRADSWWTGSHPKDPDCPGWTVDGWISALHRPDLAQGICSEVMAYYANGWVLTEPLFAALTTKRRLFVHPLSFCSVHRDYHRQRPAIFEALADGSYPAFTHED